MPLRPVTSNHHSILLFFSLISSEAQCNPIPCCRATNKNQRQVFQGTPRGGEKKEVTKQVMEMLHINLDTGMGGAISQIPIMDVPKKNQWVPVLWSLVVVQFQWGRRAKREERRKNKEKCCNGWFICKITLSHTAPQSWLQSSTYLVPMRSWRWATYSGEMKTGGFLNQSGWGG